MSKVWYLAKHLAAAVLALQILTNMAMEASLGSTTPAPGTGLRTSERLKGRQGLFFERRVIVFTAIAGVAGPEQVEVVAYPPLVDSSLETAKGVGADGRLVWVEAVVVVVNRDAAFRYVGSLWQVGQDNGRMS
jgi:hypothetical protein